MKKTPAAPNSTTSAPHSADFTAKLREVKPECIVCGQTQGFGEPPMAVVEIAAGEPGLAHFPCLTDKMRVRGISGEIPERDPHVEADLRWFEEHRTRRVMIRRPYGPGEVTNLVHRTVTELVQLHGPWDEPVKLPRNPWILVVNLAADDPGRMLLDVQDEANLAAMSEADLLAYVDPDGALDQAVERLLCRDAPSFEARLWATRKLLASGVR